VRVYVIETMSTCVRVRESREGEKERARVRLFVVRRRSVYVLI